MSIIISSGMRLTPDRLNALAPMGRWRTVDSSAVNNSTTMVNDTVMVWTGLLANAVYELHVMLRFNSNSTADLKYGWTTPAGSTFSWESDGYNTTNARAINALGGAQQPGFAGGGQGGTTDDAVEFTGLLIMGSSSGTLQGQFAQNTANASNTVLKAGSHGTLIRLS